MTGSMLGTAVLPHPKQVRDLLEGLLGRIVDIEPGDLWTPEPGEQACTAEMLDDAGRLLAVVALDLPLTVFLGAAIGLTPVGGARLMIEERDPSALVLANAYEVLNVLSVAWNVGSNPHTRLGPVHAPADRKPDHVGAWLATVGRREDLRVDVAGYGRGLLSIIGT